MFSFSINDPRFLPHVGCRLDLSVPTGKTVFLTGENGIGKSSILRRLKEDRPESLFVRQLPLDTFYDRTLEKFKATALKAFGSDLNREAFQKYWEAFGLHLKEKRLLSELSGGERQCVKLATALGMKNSLKLLDEPTQYLDEEKRQRLFEILREQNSSGTSFLVVEHDLSWWKTAGEAIPLLIRNRQIQKGESWTIS